MKYCPKCGKKLEGNEKFCSKCGVSIAKNNNKSNGAKINNKKEPKNFINNDYKEYNSETFSKKSTINNKISKVIASVVGVVCIIAIALVVFKNDIIYKYHMIKSEEAENINEKIDEYYYATEAKYNSNITNLLYNQLKDCNDVQIQIAKFDNILSKDDINKLYREIYSTKAEQEYEKNEYDKVYNLLSIAEDYGYNIKHFNHYNDLENKLKDQKKEEKKEQSNKKNLNTENNAQYTNNIVVSQSEYIIPDSNIRYLTVDELNTYNKNALALIRNEIYARHGYVFQSQPFRRYFQNKTWYSPNASYKGNDDGMNEYEKSNVNLILSLENQRN